MAVVTSNPPEQGQLVTVRQRRYVVTDVAKSTLPDRPLKVSGNGGQHLVSLSSVEDDALGEELQVNQVARLRGNVAQFAKGNLAGDDFVEHDIKTNCRREKR